MSRPGTLAAEVSSSLRTMDDEKTEKSGGAAHKKSRITDSILYLPPLRPSPPSPQSPLAPRFELMYFTDNYEPATSQQMQYVEQFQLGTLALIATLPAGTGVFSPTCLVHCLSGQTPWSQLVVDVRATHPCTPVHPVHPVNTHATPTYHGAPRPSLRPRTHAQVTAL